MAEDKYEKYIQHLDIMEMPDMGKLMSPFLAGSREFMKEIKGSRPNFALYYILRTGMFPETPHYHPNDEYLMFLGTDPHDMKNLGAVVEIAFGEEWDKTELSTSALVYFPANLQHCPIHVKKLDRPFLFGHFWPGGEEAKILPPR